MTPCAACGWARSEPPSACVRMLDGTGCGLAREIKASRQLWHGRFDRSASVAQERESRVALEGYLMLNEPTRAQHDGAC